jgi:hypothetical protein
LITMSQKELHLLEPIQRMRGGSLSVVEAVALLRFSRSQVHRLLQAYDLAGAGGLVSKKRGRPSNRRHSEAFRNLVLDLVREHYVDLDQRWRLDRGSAPSARRLQRPAFELGQQAEGAPKPAN